MNIVLIGFMGVGKSTVSRALKKQLGRKEVDTDALIVKKDGRSIPDIFAQDGEEAFRRLETEVIRELSGAEDLIISCGGGAATREENVALLKQNGVIVLLTAKPETVLRRVRGGKNRPILNGHMNAEYIAGLMEKRRAAYEGAADIVVATDGKKPQKIAEEIAAAAKNRK